jgi:uncharacterized protein
LKTLKSLAAALVIVGALNWGLVAIAEFDLVATIFGMEFGETSALTRIVYGLVGLSAVYMAADLVGNRGTAPAHVPASQRARTAA